MLPSAEPLSFRLTRLQLLHSESELLELYWFLHNGQIRRWLVSDPDPMEAEKWVLNMREVIKNQQNVVLARVFQRNVAVGFLGTFNIDKHNEHCTVVGAFGSLGVMGHTKVWGQFLFAHHLFSDWRIRKVYAHIFGRNRKARRMVESLGFVKEGVLRNHVKIEGIWDDELIYAVTADAYYDAVFLKFPALRSEFGNHALR